MIIASSAPGSGLQLRIDRAQHDYLIEICDPTAKVAGKSIAVDAQAFNRFIVADQRIDDWNSTIQQANGGTRPWSAPSGDTVFPSWGDVGVDLNVSFSETDPSLVQLVISNQGGNHLAAFAPLVQLTALLQSRVEGLEPVNLAPSQLEAIDTLVKEWQKVGAKDAADQLLAALNPFTLPTAEHSVIEGTTSSNSTISLVLLDGCWCYTIDETWTERDILANLRDLRVLRDGI